MSPHGWRLVTFDIDGTLTAVHGWRFLAQRTGRLAEFESTTQRFFAHEISETEHLRDLLQLAVGLSIEEVEGILEDTPKVQGIAETVEELQARGVRTALLTHNPRYVCEWYERKYGFERSEATEGASVRHGRVAPLGTIRAHKLGGLRSLLRALDIPAHEALHVGDGWADAALFAQMGGGISFNSRWPEVDAAADATVKGSDLRLILPALDGLSPRPPNDARASD
ncbi:MAG: HAD-IB family phosphatase [Thermoplasmata archaeon]